ncbi:cysteine oxidase/2-aminoethanethiol dioxygenase domain containing protein [Nitzschia inconspicua]|uniref:Cysteine oxidase/2-aminoethanethiol dioxygenase domain containing protein n=1 Tax=Nitzschia inconspicua TaxID=303405 RepID=A0A9K3L3C8_9STRA|nr:cysteine oxidase/2-aminoethanethiol dioxygenase domain containing protein [Nitzschia inconspicua]
MTASQLRPHIGNLLQALTHCAEMTCTGVDQDGGERSLTMNVEPPSPSHHDHPLSTAHKQLAPVSNNSDFKKSVIVQVSPSENDDMSERAVSAAPMLGAFLPPLLEEAKKSGRGLSSIPQLTLKENLQMVISALERLDAAALLDLEILPETATQCSQGPPGPRVRDGVYCRPINNQIQPTVERQPHHSCVRYLHVCEVPDQYSIGIFVFGPNARIPLHDHPDMCVLSRVLYGDLIRLSLDLARPEEAGAYFEKEERKHQPSDGQSSSSWFPYGWFGRNHNNLHHIHNNLPKGSKAAFKNEIDHLQAPDVTVLYPYEGNLHEFVAGPQGAAVLDVLLPPYDNVQNRDCTFYNIQSLWNGKSNPEDSPSSFRKKEPCFIVPTGQPENFHCISGYYRDLGEQPNHDDDILEESETMDEDEYD